MLATLTTVSSLGYKGGRLVSVLLFAAAVVFMLLSIIKFLQKGEKKAFLITIIALFMSSVVALNMSAQLKKSQQAADAIGSGECYVEGRVVDVPGYDGTYRYIIRTDDGFEFVLNTNEEMDADVNDLFKGEIELTTSAPVTVEKAVQGYGTRQSVSFSKGGKGFRGIVYKARTLAFKCINRYVPSQANSFVKGVMLGDGESFNIYLQQDFAFAGLAHLLVISGAHLSVVVAMLMKLLPCGSYRRRLAMMLIIPILFYMLMCGMGPSVVRAGFCSLMLLLGYTFKKDINPINSLGVSAMAASLLWPQGAISVGFLLSFFSTLGLLIVCPPIIARVRRTSWPRIVKFLASPIILTLSAQLFIIPLTVLCYGKVTPTVLVTNMILGWLVSLVIIFGILMLVSAGLLFTQPLTVVMGAVVRFLGALCVSVVALFTDKDNSAINVSRQELLLAMGVLYAGIMLVVGAKNRKVIKIAGSTVAAMGVVLLVLVGWISSERGVITNVTYNCTVVRYKDKTVVIGNCTSPKELGRLRKAIYESGNVNPDVLTVHRQDGQSNEHMAAYLQPKHVIKGKSEPTTLLVEEGFTVTVREDYTYVCFDDLVIAVTEEGAVLPQIKGVACTVARGWCKADTKSTVATVDAKVLANGENKVYNIEDEYFTATVGKKAGVVN